MITRSNAKILNTIFQTWRITVFRLKMIKKIQYLWRSRPTPQRCPISFKYIHKPFYVVRGNSQHVYNAHSLHEYINTTGDLLDPVTRTPFTLSELICLHYICGESYNFSTIKYIRDVLIEKRTLLLQNESLYQALEDEFITCIHRSFEIESMEGIQSEIIPTIVQTIENISLIDAERSRLLLNRTILRVKKLNFRMKTSVVNILTMLSMVQL